MSKRGRFLVNIVQERYKEKTLTDNEEEPATSSKEPDGNKENRPSNTLPTTPCQSSDQIRQDLYISSSGESMIEDSDIDPNYVYQKKKKRPIKVIPSSSSSSSSSSNTSSSSSSSDSEPDDTTAEPFVTNNDVQVPSVVQPNQEPDPVPSESKRGKKRLQNQSAWKANITKLLRNSGKVYQSMSKTKRIVPEKRVRLACGMKCRLRCNVHINEETRQTLFDSFWALANLQSQREFIVRHTLPIKPKYRYSSTQNYRSLNNAFYFEVEGEKVRVCKNFFKATLDICNTVITTALSKKNNLGVIATDLRGKHGNQPKIDTEIKDSVVKFIDSIPRIESHYLRAQTSREFICSDRSLADLYRDYKADREENQLPSATRSTFNRIFNTEFNISFFLPKKDLCDLCESFKNANEEGKLKIQESYEQHLIEKNLAREEKEKDKNRNDGVIVAVYDLQAVMQVPKGQVSLFFYKSRVNCFNFTISDLRAKDVICYFWDETEGKRGAIEIGSCVLLYIDVLLEKHPNGNIDIIFYSDNCCGQQKNKYLLSAYAYAVVNKRVKSITHKFLIRGHSQNEGDNVHSVIEKQINRHIKSGPIYTPQQYCTLIRSAKKTGSPYLVKEMTYENFVDTKMLQEDWGTNFNLDDDRNQVKWHDIKVLRVEKENPGAFFYKTSFSDENYKKVLVRKRRTKDEVVFTGLNRAYTQKIPLSEAKIKDLKDLINKHVIPQIHVDSYYKNILGDNII